MLKDKCIRSFVETKDLPESLTEISKALNDKRITKIINFVLGPEGTNIGQASKKYAREIGVDEKSEFIFCETPEESLEEAKKANTKGVLTLFWTCAVYYKLNVLFFNNPDTLPFFVNYVMKLDAMQLATREELADRVNGGIPNDWKIASHPSPAPMMEGHEIKKVNSNSAAALLCAQGKIDACITTESARTKNGLVKIREFGSPPMVFFGGITGKGASLVSEIHKTL